VFNKKEENFIEINRTTERPVFKIIPGEPKRKWMDDTKGNAYRCVPLNVANQYGWTVLSPVDFSAEWDGGPSQSSLRVNFLEPVPHNIASSDFGHGILSIIPDFVVRTSKTTSLYVRGIPNQIANGLQPLDAIVETDWLPFTFTFNYKFAKPGKLTIKKDQPLFMFFPIQRGYIDQFETKEVHIQSNQEMYEDYKRYAKLRELQNKGVMEKSKNKATYGQGRLIEKEFDIIDHQKRLNLPDFIQTDKSE
jgi:hypothetical protein